MLRRLPLRPLLVAALSLATAAPALASRPNGPAPGGSGPSGGEAALVLPDLDQATFLGLPGRTLLHAGLAVCVLGGAVGLVMCVRIGRLPVHRTMREVSELIYETCKTYLITQGKFLLLLWLLIGGVTAAYFGLLAHHPTADGTGMERGFPAGTVALILGFSLVGMGGSFAVAWFGVRVNTFANSRTAFAGLTGKAYPCYSIPLQAGFSIGLALISLELFLMLLILLYIPGEYAGPCFIGFAIGESLGATALRVAGGIFTKIADIGADLMKIVFKIKEDDARNPGVIADCTGDNAGDSVGPTADGFETYGVTGVALISVILLAVKEPAVQVQLLVWVFLMRVLMILVSVAAYWLNERLTRASSSDLRAMNFERPLTRLVWITSGIAIVVTFVGSLLLIPELGAGENRGGLWWQLGVMISCGTLAAAVIPEMVKAFTSTESMHVREVVAASRQGGASLNILSGLVAGNFSAYWLGLVFMLLMACAYAASQYGLAELMIAPQAAPVLAFGLVAFGLLGTSPITIAVDSYGPVTDNAQSVYELSLIEQVPGIAAEVKAEYGFTPDFEAGKDNLEKNDGAGNTFKATAKPVLIGTAAVGATTMIFSIVVALTDGLQPALLANLSILYPPFLLGLIAGGSVIYWFTGASIQAVTTGAHRAVEFIGANIDLNTASGRASTADSKRVVEICTRYAQAGMVNIFLALFFGTLGYAFVEPYFFIGYLISIALFGLFQAMFMANAGGAWDNAKKIVETELREKGTELHAATVVGDMVGDPFKDTSSVAMNPIIKFTTLFGLLAVDLAVSLRRETGGLVTYGLAAAFLAVSFYFVRRSFVGMRIDTSAPPAGTPAPTPAEAGKV